MEEKEVLHLMINNLCRNNCPLCCNKQYDVAEIPVVSVEELKKTKVICITGGEPFLCGDLLPRFLENMLIQYPNLKQVFIYTSGGELGKNNLKPLIKLQGLGCKIGLSIGPKSSADRKNLRENSGYIWDALKKLGPNRFYCFNGADREVAEGYYPGSNLDVIEREWQENFVPAPNTIFRRLPVWIV